MISPVNDSPVARTAEGGVSDQSSRLQGRCPSIRTTVVLLAIIVAVGTGLRLHLLGEKNFWLDEGISIWLATLPWSRFVRVVWVPELHFNMVLYYTLLRGWWHFGNTEFAVRSLSLLFGVAAIPAIYKLGQRLFSAETGLIAAALLAAHSFHIRFSQEARGYTLEVLLLILSTFLFCRINDFPSRKRYWIGYVVASALAVYCHPFAVLVVGSHWVAIGVARLRAVGVRAVTSIVVGLGLLLAPLAVYILVERDQGLTWIPRPTLMFFLGTMRQLTGSGDVARTVSSLLLTLLYGVSWAIALWGTYLRRRADLSKNEWFAIRLTLLWIVLPIATTLLVSLLVKPLFFSRYLLMCVPAMVLLAAQGLVTFANSLYRRKVGLAIATALMVSLSLVETNRFFQTFPSYGHHWRAVVHHILTKEQPGDAVCISMGLEPFEYYVRRETQWGGQQPNVSFPPEIGVGDRGFEPGRVLEQASSGRRRVWLVFRSEEETRVRASVPQHLRPVEETVFPGSKGGELRIVLYERR